MKTEGTQGTNALSWLASLILGGILAAHVSFPWGGREGVDAAAVIAYVLGRVERSYVSPVDEQKLTEQTLSHLAESLDRWSAYIPPAEYAAFDEEAEGRFGGIGVVFERREEGYFVTVVLRDGPADRAGVRAGDALLRAAGVELVDKEENEIKRYIRGIPGTTIALLLRGADRQERTVLLERKIIHDPSVHRVGFLAETPIPIGHLRIERFQRETSAELDQALDRLLGRNIEALVIDLRRNPGGLYDEAVAVADRFLPEGVIVSTSGREPDDKNTKWASSQVRCPPMRIAILVDQGTASAAEIVAAALREHGRAILIGNRTYGKGSVQSVYEVFGEGARWGALKLTTKRYFTPKGNALSDGGLPVDAEVTQDETEFDELWLGWQAVLRRTWNDPTEPAASLLNTAQDTVLQRSLDVLSDPSLYDTLLNDANGLSDAPEKK